MPTTVNNNGTSNKGRARAVEAIRQRTLSGCSKFRAHYRFFLISVHDSMPLCDCQHRHTALELQVGYLFSMPGH